MAEVEMSFVSKRTQKEIAKFDKAYAALSKEEKARLKGKSVTKVREYLNNRTKDRNPRSKYRRAK